MTKFCKPTVVVSKCITFSPVRWDGQIISSEIVEKLKSYVNFIPVCPEAAIGLGVPRDPVRVVLVNGKTRLLQPSTGIDFTDKMKAFVNSFLDSLKDIDGFILKSGSPSSGFKNVKIYPKIDRSAPIGKGLGFFGKAVLQKFPHSAIEDERRLLNLKIKQHFLTKIFTLASFRETKRSGTINKLVRFHTENKYLLTAYNQKELGILGKIVANQEQRSCDQIFNAYETHLNYAFANTPKVGSNINVMLKIMGYFSHQLSRDEKSFFINSLDKYRNARLPLSAIISILKAWIIRFEQKYLLEQTLLEPYPEEFVDV